MSGDLGRLSGATHAERYRSYRAVPLIPLIQSGTERYRAVLIPLPLSGTALKLSGI